MERYTCTDAFVDGMLLTDCPEVDYIIAFVVTLITNIGAFVQGFRAARRNRKARMAPTAPVVTAAPAAPAKRVRTVRKARTGKVVPTIDDCELVVSIDQVLGCVDVLGELQ